MVSETPQPPQERQIRIAPGTLIALGVFAAVIIAVGIVLATLNADAPPASPTSVMPGHGSVMPTDVRSMAGPGELKVLLGDYWLKPSTRRLPAGRYRFTVQNMGVIPHDLMVERAPIVMSAPGQPLDNAAAYGLDGLEPGVVRSTDITLAAGTWVLFCSVSGHYQAGQRAVIRIHGRLPKGLQMPAGSSPMGTANPRSARDSGGMG